MGDVIYITHHKVGSRAGLGPGAHVAVGWVVKRQSAAAARRWTKRLLVERRVTPRVPLGDKDRRRHGLHYGCHVRKLTVLTIGFAVGLTFAPAANAAPKPQQQGSNCDSNYSGACVPIASDVDCASGSGNGPAYVSGEILSIPVDGVLSVLS
jgi:hypothetical protein